MDNPFSQPKLIYKVKFNTFYKYIELFEAFFPEDNLGISSYEVESKTIESEPCDVWCIEVYLATKPNRKIYSNNLKNFIGYNNLEILGEVNFTILEDKDWVAEYQKQLVPINIGTFFISSLEKSKHCPPSSIPIILEASRAFGTGDHATTSGCLKAMEELISSNFTTIFDIGTGSGILSFAANKLWPEATILACDIEKIAVEVANFNQKFNNSDIYFYQNSSESLEIPEKYDQGFDLIISNILANPLINLAPNIFSLLNTKGKLVLSGFLNYQMDEVLNAYSKLGMIVSRIINNHEWVVLVMQKN